MKTKAGTFSSRSGLPQVPPNSNCIPQSLLNNVGRGLDSVTFAPNQGLISYNTPGGVTLDLQGMIQSTVAAFLRLPFQVDVSEVGNNEITVTIAEGRIFGRVDWETAEYDFGSYYSPLPSVGTAGIDPNFTGVFPAGDVPDTTGNQGKSVTPAGQTPSSNAAGSGSVTNKPRPGTSSSGKGSFYSNNSNYKSGNAGSITQGAAGQTGVFHTKTASGNAGSITSVGQQGGIYHTQLPSGNAGSL